MSIRGQSLAAAVRRCAGPCVLLVLLTIGLPTAGAKTASFASVRFIQGGLMVQPPHSPGHAGKVKEALFDAYFLRTQESQLASVGFVDGTKLNINQRTDLVLSSPHMTVLKRGEVNQIDTPGSTHRVSTANAVAAAVGTTFDVKITSGSGSSSGYGPSPTPGPLGPPGTTTVSVTNGVVAVSNPLGRVLVHKGEWTHVRPGQAPTKPTRHNARADIAWARSIP